MNAGKKEYLCSCLRYLEAIEIALFTDQLAGKEQHDKSMFLPEVDTYPGKQTQ